MFNRGFAFLFVCSGYIFIMRTVHFPLWPRFHYLKRETNRPNEIDHHEQSLREKVSRHTAATTKRNGLNLSRWLFCINKPARKENVKWILRGCHQALGLTLGFYLVVSKEDSEERPEVIIIFPLSRFRIRDFHLVSASSRAVGSWLSVGVFVVLAANLAIAKVEIWVRRFAFLPLWLNLQTASG